MDRYTFFQNVKIEDGRLQMVQSNEPLSNPQPVENQYDFYSRIKLDENGKIVVKVKEIIPPTTPTPTPSITPTQTPTSTSTSTPTNTPTPTPSATPTRRQATEFELVATGSTAPGSGDTIFNTLNACLSGAKLTVMNISYVDRFGNNVESKVKSYSGATGSTKLYIYQTSGAPIMFGNVSSLVDNGTYATITTTALSGTCGSGAYDIGQIIEFSLFP